MEGIVIAVVAVAAALFIILVLTLVPAIIVYRAIFNARQDKNPKFRYYEAEDAGIKSRPLKVAYRGVRLHSRVYSAGSEEDSDRVVVFVHGFGAGTSSYTTEIVHFARCGFIVVATDAYGCNDSEGDSIVGFYAGAEAAIATCIAVRADAVLGSKKLVLAGHSWGAYSVLAASKKVKADGVVALSAFTTPAQCVKDSLTKMGGLIKAYAPFLKGWFYLINLIKFGAAGNTNAARAIERSRTRALLIQGDEDSTVPLNHSAASAADGENIKKLIIKGKRHNPYATRKAEEALALLVSQKFKNEQEEQKFYDTFDWEQAVEEDVGVMNTVDEFIRSV